MISHKYPQGGPRIVVIGGGTGLSTMLRGLKLYSSNITAVVAVSDDGGGSGILRRDLGMIPPGDIRNCILALADTEPIMEKLLQYRFKEGMLKGQNFGNLFLAAMAGITSGFEDAVRKMSDVLAVTGKVLPVTLDDVTLCAELDDGHIIYGESNISTHNSFHQGRIKRVYLDPHKTSPMPDALDEIMKADAVVIGPGSLYTSIIPNLLVNGLADCIKKTGALIIYVCNIMTQPGETDGFSASDHIQAIERHTYQGLVEHCIVNTAPISGDMEEKYLDDGAGAVCYDLKIDKKDKMQVTGSDLVCTQSGYLRHNPGKLAHIIIGIVESRICKT